MFLKNQSATDNILKERKEVLILSTDYADLTDFNKKLICQIC
jgi:hypothetical protein